MAGCNYSVSVRECMYYSYFSCTEFVAEQIMSALAEEKDRSMCRDRPMLKKNDNDGDLER